MKKYTAALISFVVVVVVVVGKSFGFVSRNHHNSHHHHKKNNNVMKEPEQQRRAPSLMQRSLQVRLEQDDPVSSSKKKEQGKGGGVPSSSLLLLNTLLTSSSPVVYSPLPCDDVNRPPSLNILLRTLHQLTHGGSSTDIRGRYVNHKRVGSLASVAYEIGKQPSGPYAPLTPFAAYCLGYGFAQYIRDRITSATSSPKQSSSSSSSHTIGITIAVGQDPRPHGMRLADAFCRGAESLGDNDDDNTIVQARYTGIATTPACAAFGRLHGVTGSVMVTASHLPIDRNGFKLFYQGNCLSLSEIALVGTYASQCAVEWYTKGTIPPTSGDGAVMCSSWVNYMPAYAASLKDAIQRQVVQSRSEGTEQETIPCLEGLNILVNAGHGSGGFFTQVLKDLGANVDGSLGVEPDENFPLGIPNPEYKPAIDATIKACETHKVDLGIMLDTDSDRCGFVVPVRSSSSSSTKEEETIIRYEPLNRNRLIALMGVILAREHPQGCGVVTDSVSSEGLSTFLQDTLGLTHVRYLKGYQNVIGKAKELTETGVLNCELGMETSGHGAMKENYYLDDGTYTAVKVISLLAQEIQKGDAAGKKSLLDLIADMVELDVIRELRFKVLDDSLETMREVFDFCALEIENVVLELEEKSGGGVVDGDDTTTGVAVPIHAPLSWSLDTENLEGIRVRVGKGGQFFMLRKSLHDPIISLQVEAASLQEASDLIIQPLLKLFESEEQIRSRLDLSVLREF